MPVREIDKRKLERQELQEVLGRWDNHLRDRDWIARLKANADWKRLGELFLADTAPEREQLEKLKQQLIENPLTPAEAAKLREAVMLMERDRKVLENLLTFPDREVERLKEIETRYPEEKAKLDRLDQEFAR